MKKDETTIKRGTSLWYLPNDYIVIQNLFKNINN